jgi:hypothetical protein
MVVLPLTVEAVGQVLYNLRAADRREIEATVHRFDSRALAEATCACRLGFVAAVEDPPSPMGYGGAGPPSPEGYGGASLTPIAVLAAGELWPGVWQLGLFATPRWPEVGGAVTRFARRWLEPRLRALGAHRAQAFSLADHDDAHRWMLRLGARCEATLAGWGRGGEDFKVFVWR